MKDTAILVYIPDEQSFIDQFWGLYYSVQHSKQNREKFSFVIMCTEGAEKKLPKDNCVYFTREKELSEHEGFQYKYSGNPYKYINSWHHFSDDEVIAYLRDNFNNLLRIDVDTFVTPSGYLLGVVQGEIKVGTGGYASAESTVNLRRTCADLNIPYKEEIHNLGSTWYGRTNDVIDLGRTALKYAKYLLNEDAVFKEHEGEWPIWYAGVITMYAGHLAACKCNYKMTPFRLDIGTSGDEKWDSCYTAHCWHSGEFFSKFKFAAGDYDSLTPTRKDWEKSGMLSDYGLWCAWYGRKDRRNIYTYATDSDDSTPETVTINNIVPLESDGAALVTVDLRKQNIQITITENGQIHIRRN